MYAFAEVGPASSYNVHDNNQTNLLTAIAERIFLVKPGVNGVVPIEGIAHSFRPPPTPKNGAWRDGMAAVGNKLKTILNRMTPAEGVTAFTPREFCDGYKGRRRVIYEQAMDSLSEREVQVRDSWLKPFVKAEKTAITSTKRAVPRMIQPRDPRYGLSLGCYTRPIEKLIQRAVKRMYGGHTILKGMNPDESGTALRAMWDTFADPVAVGVDASRFDQHCSIDALSFEHSIYLHLYKQDPQLAKLLKWQLNNQGVCYVSGHKTKYKVQGRRMSGDMNTSLGNCLLMSCMMYAFYHSVGIKARLANMGDDCVCLCERSELHKLSSLGVFFYDLGYTMEVEEPVYEFEKIVFCQTSPVHDGRGWLMVRDPMVAIAKDLLTVTPMTNASDYHSYRRAVGECGLAIAGGIPVLDAFYRMCIRDTDTKIKPGKGFNKTHVTDIVRLEQLRSMVDRSKYAILDEARDSFWRSSGIEPALQVEYERYFDSVELEYGVAVLRDSFVTGMNT